MTKDELLQAIRANWFHSDEDLVDFIFEQIPEIKESDTPVVHCKDCWYSCSEGGANICSCYGIDMDGTYTRAIKKRQINLVEELKKFSERWEEIEREAGRKCTTRRKKMRLIDADKLKKHYTWWGSENASDELKERKKDFDDIIDVQPTVEAEPIRHGKWTDNGEVIICSECGHFSYYMDCEDEYMDEDGFEHWSLGYPFYCKNCGAKMDGKEQGK